MYSRIYEKKRISIFRLDEHVYRKFSSRVVVIEDARNLTDPWRSEISALGISELTPVVHFERTTSSGSLEKGE